MSPTHSALSGKLHSAEEWEGIHQLFEDLYLQQKLRLVDVSHILATEHGFYATSKQYKTRIHDWKIVKNQKRAFKTNIINRIENGDSRLDSDPQNVPVSELRLQRQSNMNISKRSQRCGATKKIEMSDLLCSAHGTSVTHGIPRLLTPEHALEMQSIQAAVSGSCTWLSARSLHENDSPVLAGLGFGWRLREEPASMHPSPEAMYDLYSAADDALMWGLVPPAISLFREAMKALIVCLKEFSFVCLIRLLDVLWMLGKQFDFELKGFVETIVKHVKESFGSSHPIGALLALLLQHGHECDWQLAVWQALITHIQLTGTVSAHHKSVVEAARYYHAKNNVRGGNIAAAIVEYEALASMQPIASWNWRRTNFRLGELYWIQGKSEDAMTTFTKIVRDGQPSDGSSQIDGIQWESHHSLALINEQLGRPFTAYHHHFAAFDGALRAYGSEDAETVFFFRDLISFLESRDKNEVIQLREKHPEISSVLDLPEDTVEAALLKSKLRPSSSKFLHGFFMELQKDARGRLLPRKMTDYAVVSKPNCRITIMTGIGMLRAYGNSGDRGQL